MCKNMHFSNAISPRKDSILVKYAKLNIRFLDAFSERCAFPPVTQKNPKWTLFVAAIETSLLDTGR